MNVFRQWLVFLTILVILSACAVSDDPSKGGFIDGVVGLSQGTYDKRQQERRDNLAAIRNLKKDTLREQDDLEMTLDDKKKEVVALKADFGELSRKNDALAMRVVLIQVTTVKDRSKKSHLNQRLKAIKKRIGKLEKGPSLSSKDFASSLAIYKADKKRLEDALADLEKDILDLEPR